MNADEVLRSIEKEASEKGLPIIGPEKGLILDEVVRQIRPKRVVEIGTLVGYSAIRMARLLPKEGRVTCLELSRQMAAVAQSNFQRAGVSEQTEVLVGDAKTILPELDGEADLLLIDANKNEYLTYLRSCERLLHPGSVVVADNVKVFEDQVADYLRYVRSSGKYSSSNRDASLNADRSVIDAVEISIRL